MIVEKVLDGLITEALHGVAWIALRLQSPVKARQTVASLGARVRPFATTADARSGASRFLAKGSCLSRSLAISARLPGSSVVIGTDPRWSSRFTAHAWVEFEAETIDVVASDGPRSVEFARL